MPKSFSRSKPVIHGGVEVPKEQLHELELGGVFLRKPEKTEQQKPTEVPKEQLHELNKASFFQKLEELKRHSKSNF